MPVAIKKLVNGAYGLAALPDNDTLLVRGVLPGETVDIDMLEQRRRVSFARAVAVRRPHPGRVKPPCPYYGDCGGCDLQHADYPTQLEQKQEILAELLQRSGSTGLPDRDRVMQTIVPSPEHLGYRQRIRLNIDHRVRIGFHRFRSNKVVVIKQCLLAAASINRCLGSLPENPHFHRLADTSTAVELLANPLDDRVSLLLHFCRPPRPADRAAAATLCLEVEDLARIFFTGSDFAIDGPFTAGGRTSDNYFSTTLPIRPPITLFWEAAGFSQVNTGQNGNLVRLVLETCGIAPGESILDLYCGMGNFSLPLAARAGEVLGLEGQGASVRCARYGADYNRLANVSFHKTEVLSGCNALVQEGRRFDIIVCDPPRRGMPGLAPYLAALARKSLVYISCDPATLCRDLVDLEAAGFTLKTITPIDMFPQTHHIEAVAFLEKN